MVAGSAGGRSLAVPRATPAVRPTSERVREAIFASLGSMGAVVGADVVDLFAGSGALGIEALSRGAGRVTFVDASPGAIDTIRANLTSTGLGPGPRARVVRGEVASFLASERHRWDLALVDPPYGFRDWDDLFAVLEADLVVAETGRDRHGDDDSAVPGLRWRVIRSRAYGGTVVTFFASDPATGREARPSDQTGGT